MFVLSEQDVNRVVAMYGAHEVMNRLIDGIDAGFRSMASGDIVHSPRKGFAKGSNLIEWMPVHDQSGTFVVKVVSYFPSNPLQQALPTVGAVITRFDFATGQVTDVVGGRLLTAMRTGAASAVASRYMAKADSTTLGLIGCGVQAVTQAHALCRLFPIKRVLAFDTDLSALSSLSVRLAFLGLEVIASSLDQIERQSDIICTATTSDVGAPPVLTATNLLPHAHINAVGADFPGKIELPPRFTRESFIATDLMEQARIEGECQVLTATEAASSRCVELKTIVSAPAEFARFRACQTIYDSTGIAMEDAVAVAIICDLARKAGIGSINSTVSHGFDPKNPYGEIEDHL